jgi:hypothetical protein
MVAKRGPFFKFKMQQHLHHTRIDLLKMDIEDYEWLMFDSWPELSDQKRSEELLLPLQPLVEVSYVYWGVYTL